MVNKDLGHRSTNAGIVRERVSCPEPQGGLSYLFVAAHEFKSKYIVCIIR